MADSDRGAQVLARERCLECHKLDAPARSGPFLRLLKKQLTPTALVGAIWEHAPSMWKASRDSLQPTLTRPEALDLIVYFAARGYFETPGKAAEGLRVYRNQGCGRCHDGSAAQGPPVEKWTSVENAIELFHAMWRHAPHMKAAMDRKQMPWPSLSSEEIRHLQAYVTSSSGPGPAPRLRIGDPERGRKILDSKQCTGCHTASKTFEVQTPHSLTDLAAVLWNHAPMMMSLPPSLNRNEIADLVGWLWTARYFEEAGRASRGKEVFERKRCGACHSSFSVTGEWDAASLLVALWRHTPPVIADARSKEVAWPTFAGREMADLIAYLNSIRRPPLIK